MHVLLHNLVDFILKQDLARADVIPAFPLHERLSQGEAGSQWHGPHGGGLPCCSQTDHVAVMRPWS